ncbi:MAG: NF038122 family metalloprotease [Bacteroidota bacterium]
MSVSFRLGAALAAVALLAAPALAQADAARFAAAPVSDHPAGFHVITVGPDGHTQCAHPEAGTPEARHARMASNVRLTPVFSTNAPGSTSFRIILRATDQLLAQPEALLSFRRAAARWERIIQTPVTTVIDVDYGPNRFGVPFPSDNILASASSAQRTTSLTPTDLVTLFKTATTDADLIALYDAIPVPTPSTARNGDNSVANLGTALIGTIPLQVYGVLPAALSANTGESVPNIGFNSAFDFDFDPSNGVLPGQIDFEAVVAHEIGHNLGFVSVIGNGGPPSNLFTPWDLFRVRPSATEPGESYTDGTGWEAAERVVTPGPVETEVIGTEGGQQFLAAVQTTFLGDVEYETSTSTGAGTGGDGRQASHWRDDALRLPSLGDDRKIGIMDPNLGPGIREEIADADIRLLDLIGYEVTLDPVFAEARFTLNGERLNTEGPLLLDEVYLGDAPAGGTGTATLRIDNLDPEAVLDYEVEFVADGALPEGTEAVVPMLEGALAADSGTDLTLSFGAGAEPAFVVGRLFLRTNDRTQLVVDLPATFSVGGAGEPRLGVETSGGASLGELPTTGPTTYTVTLTNEGSFPLSYTLLPSLARDDVGFSIDPQARRADDPVVLFEADFDTGNGIPAFLRTGPNAGDWRSTDAAEAELPGHSAPNAAHFGFQTGSGIEGFTLGYPDNASGAMYTPSFSLAPYDLTDVATVSFAYYLDVPAGDVADLVVSTDDGQTATVLTSSEGGMLVNDGTWRTVSVRVSGFAGQDDRVRFGWRFTSDATGTGTGFLVDDIAVEVDEGAGFFASGLEGTLAGNASDEITLTVDGENLGPGFYLARVDVRTDARITTRELVDVRFTTGGAIYPTLPLPAGVSENVQPDTVTPLTLSATNPSTSVPLSYLRVLEPALSRLDPQLLARRPAPGPRPEAPSALTIPEAEPALASASEARGGASVADVVLPGAEFPLGLGQLGDGRLLVSDGDQRGTVYVVAADLSSVSTVSAPSTDQQITGFAYDERTDTIWLAEFQSQSLRETRLEAGGLVATGARITLGFAPINLSYSAEIDALFFSEYLEDRVYAVTREGDTLPGYPVTLDDPLVTNIPGLSFREGVLEIGDFANTLRQLDQFGRAFEGATGTLLPSEGTELFGAIGFTDYVRSRTDPDGTAFFITREGSDGEFRVIQTDPPDLPEGVGTRVDAAVPLGADRAVAPGASLDLDLLIDARGLAQQEIVADEIAFLVNDPSNPVVRLPISITLFPVADEDGAEAGAFAVAGAVPNPLREAGEVRFTLAEAAEVTVTVFNVLGQRVAVLAEREPLGAGAHTLPIEAGALASGTYVVRVEAGAEVGTQTLTVVR